MNRGKLASRALSAAIERPLDRGSLSLPPTRETSRRGGRGKE